MHIRPLSTLTMLPFALAATTAFAQFTERYEPPREAVIERPILGLQVGPLRTRNYRLLGISTERGAIVEDVISGSPAERYGVPRGAIIIGLNGMRVDHVNDLMVMMTRVPLDRPVQLTYVVGGRAYRQSIPLVEVQPAEGVVREEFAERAPLDLPPPPAPEPPAVAADPFAPTPAKRAPEDKVRLPSATGVAKIPVEEDRVTAMQAELAELRRRAAALEASLKELREE